MKTRLCLVILIVMLSAITLGQRKPDHIDPATVSPAHYKVLLDNEHVRVLEYRINPGEKEALHTHPPKVSYVVSGGRLRITTGNGDSFVVDEPPGRATWMRAIGPHFGENIGTTPVRIALVEIKSLAEEPFGDIAVRD